MSKINFGPPDFDPSEVIRVIEEGLQVEKLNLEANKAIKNEIAVLILEHRITEAEIFLSFLRYRMLSQRFL